MAALALLGGGIAQDEAGSRVVPVGDNPNWVQVEAREGSRALVDRRSIRSADGSVLYMGRIVFERPDENGVLEIIHLGQIDCAARNYRTLAYDLLGRSGRLLSSHRTPVETRPIAINAGSPNAALHAEFCGPQS